VAALWANHEIALWMRGCHHYVVLAQKIKQMKGLPRENCSGFSSGFLANGFDGIQNRQDLKKKGELRLRMV
jgi:hypothetical protein